MRTSILSVLTFAVGTIACGTPSLESSSPLAGDGGPAAPNVARRAMPEPDVVEEFVTIDGLPAAHAARPTAAAPTGLRHLYSHVLTSIEHDVARTTVTDVFVNDTSSPSQLIYRFPLPEDASVIEIAEIVDGVRRPASVADRDSARREFDRAEAAGERASLGEAEGFRFRMTFSTVAPGDTRRVELTYVQTVSSVGAERTYVFPHRHVDASRPRLFEIATRVTSDQPLVSMSTPNQPDARIHRSTSLTGLVRVHRLSQPLGTDVVIRWSERAEPIELAGRAAAPKGADPGYFEARLAFNTDPYAAARRARDVVIVLDVSLSMSGEPLEAARITATRALELLGPSDRFALVTFDESLRSSGALELASDAAKARALATLAALRPGGASNIDAAIDRAAELLRGSEEGVLLLLSDGQPTIGTDLDTLMPAATRDDFEHTTTIVGLFNYPSRERVFANLFSNLTVRFIPNGPAARPIAHSVATLALAPRLDHVAMEVHGADADGLLVPSATQLVLGEALRVRGRAHGPVTVTVSAELEGRPLRMTWTSEPQNDARLHDQIAVEWARARITVLEAAYRDAPSDALRSEISTLGLAHSLATMFTSFVATDSLGPDRVMPGDPEIRVRAPQHAERVFAVLPWGEIVSCAWSEAEQLWIGRFLVPRGTEEGLYRARVFVVEQGITALRRSLAFRVDEAAPIFDVTLEGTERGLALVARPREHVFDMRGDVILPDRVDVRSLVVRIGSERFTLVQEGALWRAPIGTLERGPHRAQVIATDYASNVSRRDVRLEAP